MAKYLIVANWKQNGSKKILENLTKSFLKARKIKNSVVLLPPSIYLSSISSIIGKDKKFSVGIQNISPHKEGAFTGEISASMIKDFGARYILIGHSERRHIFQESNNEISNKLILSMENKFSTILCVGETIIERNKKITKKVIANQLKTALFKSKQLIKQNSSKLIIAYEPVWAIGTGKTAQIKDIEDVHAYIRLSLSRIIGPKHKSIKILYGGSVNNKNASTILSLDDVDGALVGGASLNSKKFIEICSSI